MIDYYKELSPDAYESGFYQSRMSQLFFKGFLALGGIKVLFETINKLLMEKIGLEVVLKKGAKLKSDIESLEQSIKSLKAMRNTDKSLWGHSLDQIMSPLQAYCIDYQIEKKNAKLKKLLLDESTDNSIASNSSIDSYYSPKDPDLLSKIQNAANDLAKLEQKSIEQNERLNGLLADKKILESNQTTTEARESLADLNNKIKEAQGALKNTDSSLANRAEEHSALLQKERDERDSQIDEIFNSLDWGSESGFKENFEKVLREESPSRLREILAKNENLEEQNRAILNELLFDFESKMNSLSISDQNQMQNYDLVLTDKIGPSKIMIRDYLMEVSTADFAGFF
jgi:hypothetical protein